MSNSRKYPRHPSLTERIFSNNLTLAPLEIPLVCELPAIHCLYILWSYRAPTTPPQEISIPSVRGVWIFSDATDFKFRCTVTVTCHILPGHWLSTVQLAQDTWWTLSGVTGGKNKLPLTILQLKWLFWGPVKHIQILKVNCYCHNLVVFRYALLIPPCFLFYQIKNNREFHRGQ